MSYDDKDTEEMTPQKLREIREGIAMWGCRDMLKPPSSIPSHTITTTTLDDFYPYGLTRPLTPPPAEPTPHSPPKLTLIRGGKR